MPNDPADLLPADPPAPPRDDPPANRGRVQCEFCECQLTHRGEVLKFSDKARAYRDSDGKDEKHARQITDLETKIATLQAQLLDATKGKDRGGLMLG